jgi:broad specificity phosphatase PhoE
MAAQAPDAGARPIRLALIRHAETAWVAEDRFQGRLDPPLSPRGVRQAELLAARLAEPGRDGVLPLPSGPPAGIWHSPLTRARSTAELVHARQPEGTALRPSDALLEIGAGEWEGRLNSELAATEGERLAAWRLDPTTGSIPGGEPILEAAARVDAGISAILDELRARPEPEPWAVVLAHDGILRLAAFGLLALPYECFWELPFSLCAISVIEIAPTRRTLRAHNLADHLAPLAGTDALAAAEARGDRRGTL